MQKSKRPVIQNASIVSPTRDRFGPVRLQSFLLAQASSPKHVKCFANEAKVDDIIGEDEVVDQGKKNFTRQNEDVYFYLNSD